MWLVPGYLALTAAACKQSDGGGDDRVALQSAGVRQPAPPLPAITRDEQATIEAAMAARDEIAGLAETRARDCDAAARDIEAVVQRSRSILAASAGLARDPAKHRWMRQTYGARMLASSSKLMGLMERCDPHEGLHRIFESLE